MQVKIIIIFAALAVVLAFSSFAFADTEAEAGERFPKKSINRLWKIWRDEAV